MNARSLWLFAIAGLLLVLLLADRLNKKPVTPVAVAQRAAPTLRAALDRPLFSPTRREPEPPPLPTQPPPVPAPPDAKVLGIVTTGGKSAALVRISGVETRVQQGDTIGGWVVESIAQSGVGLRFEDTTLLLSPPATAPGDAGAN